MAADPFARADDATEIVAAKKYLAHVDGVLRAPAEDFQTRNVDELEVDFEGIRGDLHHGYTRSSGGREPWYARGTQMRNERQLSLVAPDELQEIARAMGIPRIRPEWIGANLVLSGLTSLSMIPGGTLLFFKGGVTLKVDSQNGPCRVAGAAVARNAGLQDPDAAALRFPRVARRLRGLVAWVEKPGVIKPGEEVSVRIPEQWIYQP